MTMDEMQTELIDLLSNGYSPKDLMWEIVYIVENRAKETSPEESMRHFGFWHSWRDEEDDEE